jgi:hypothetical protein
MQPITLDAANHMRFGCAYLVCLLAVVVISAEKRTLKTHADLHRMGQIGQIGIELLNCPRNLHSIAADGLQHIKSAQPKRQCNHTLRIRQRYCFIM